MEITVLNSMSKGYKRLNLQKEILPGGKKTIFTIVYFEFEEALCSEAYLKLRKAKKAFKQFLEESNNLVV